MPWRAFARPCAPGRGPSLLSSTVPSCPSVSLPEAGGQHTGQLLGQQQLEFWERLLGYESPSLIANSESWGGGNVQTREMESSAWWLEAGARHRGCTRGGRRAVRPQKASRLRLPCIPVDGTVEHQAKTCVLRIRI